jgi:hypothetical protein
LQPPSALAIRHFAEDGRPRSEGYGLTQNTSSATRHRCCLSGRPHPRSPNPPLGILRPSPRDRPHFGRSQSGRGLGALPWSWLEPLHCDRSGVVHLLPSINELAGLDGNNRRPVVDAGGRAHFFALDHSRRLNSWTFSLASIGDIAGPAPKPGPDPLMERSDPGWGCIGPRCVAHTSSAASLSCGSRRAAGRGRPSDHFNERETEG